MSVYAIVLAGQPNSGPLQETSDAVNEALIEINGKPMAQFVLDALGASEQVERILVLGPDPELAVQLSHPKAEFLQNSGGIIDHIMAAARHLPHDKPYLLATSDIPLLTPEVVDGFLALCQGREADVFYPVIEKKVNDRLYPSVKRTYVTLTDGIFTGGNLFLINPKVIEEKAPLVEEFLNYRKSPLKLAGLLGWSFLFRLLFKRLSLAAIEAKVNDLLGLRGAVVLCPYPEVGIDVDKPSDLQLARAALPRA